MLRRSVSRPVFRGVKPPSGAQNQIFITVRQLMVCWCGGALSDERTSRLQLLLALASTVILGSETRRTRDHILLSQIRDFLFCRLLRLAGTALLVLVIKPRPEPHRKRIFLYCVFSYCRESNVSIELFPSNGCSTVACLHSCHLPVGLHVSPNVSQSLCTEQVGQSLTLCTRLREILGTNLSQDSSYLLWA
jgi:hypothetical protein